MRFREDSFSEANPRSDFREPGAFGPKDLVNGFREQTASPAARPGAEDGRGPRRTARPGPLWVSCLSWPYPSMFRLALPALADMLTAAETVLAATGNAVALCPVWGTDCCDGGES